ncbi:MAG TPA: hypothetical protein P5293_08725 [Bacteroidales bacterium]|nr:hypothetical protein [Bacteroidales bacterium]
MFKRFFILFIMIVFISCGKSDTETKRSDKTNIKSEEERLLEQQERDKARQQMFAERKEKYKDMLAENRDSGDVRGIWIINGDDIKNIINFLNIEIKPSMHYCIQVSDDMQTGKIYFTVIDKVFDIKIEKISETKYKMIYNNKERKFDVVKLKGSRDPTEWYLEIFYDDFHKYNPSLTLQSSDGISFYEICTSGINDWECSVEGCLQYIKQMDEISKAESDGPLGIE